MQRAARLWLIIEALAVLSLVGLVIKLRWGVLSVDGFFNYDVAGITYSADLLRHGLLPMVDSHEFKAPGSFYLVSAVWTVFGRSIPVLHNFMCFWAILAMLGVYTCGRLLFGRRAAFAAALLYALCAPITDQLDINYGAWMITPYVWSVAALIASLKTGRLRWLVAAGALLAISGLIKRQAGVLFPVFVAMPLLAPYLEWPEDWAQPSADWADRRRAMYALFGGLAIGFGPIMFWYLIHGELITFIKFYFFSSSGWSYLAGTLGWKAKWLRIEDGFAGLLVFMGTPILLAAASFFAAGRPRLGARGVLLGSFFWLSFLGMALGLRFFQHYYLQVLPAAVLIAAMPCGALLRWFNLDLWRSWRQRSASFVALLVTLLVLFSTTMSDCDQLKKIRKQRVRPHDGAAKRIAKVINRHAKPGDMVWVMGWRAWPVYYYTDQIAPTRFYKSMSVLTTHLTNTWRRPTKRRRFEPRGPWRLLMSELEARPPAFIIVGKHADYSKFTALHQFLKKNYRSLRAAEFNFYRRLDHE